MNKFDGLDIVLLETHENKTIKAPVKKSFFSVFACLVFCGVVAALAAFNMLVPVKTFLQTEYDYSKKDIIDLPLVATSVLPTSLTIKMPFVASVAEAAGELVLTPYDVCTVKAGTVGVVSSVSVENDNKSVSIKLPNGCVIKYSGLAYVGVKEGFAVAENSPVGLAESDVQIIAYLNDIRLPLTATVDGEIVWQN